MKVIRLFLSSPGDVEEERQKVPVVVAQINQMLGDIYKVRLDVIDWKFHVAPDMGRPQEVINRQIGDYDIFVGVMWKRFGTPTGKAESGTEEEFNIAYENWEKINRPRILFYFSQASFFPRNTREIKQLAKVISFKEKLKKKGLIFEYEKPDAFADLLRIHLAKVLKDLFPSKEGPKPAADFSRYLRHLRKENMYIDIRGLVTGKGKAHRFRIDRLFIPLKTTGTVALDEKRVKKTGRLHEDIVTREVLLEEALVEKMLLIRGDPGAGKTTFLRLIAFLLTGQGLGEKTDSKNIKIVWPDPPPVPILIPLGRLTEHIREWKIRKSTDTPVQEDSPEWLVHFLVTQSKEYNWNLSKVHFRNALKAGRCMIMLDGLDEAPDSITREKVSKLAENLLKAFPRCRIVLTTRPAALIGIPIPSGFINVEIAPLDIQSMESFLTRWSESLFPESPEKSCTHQQELCEVLNARPEIRRIAHTPVMLTALAVVHWNEHRLPEQRAELYESILIWLFRSREQRKGRLKADRCRKLLQKLALAMFTHPDGRRRQVDMRWGTETLSTELDSTEGYTPVERADYFMHDEMVDSGIIVERTNRLEFWHLSFQEYLAAFEIAGLPEEEQIQVLFEKDRLFSSEWRELVLLFGGVLHKQGVGKVNYLIDRMIEKCPEVVTHKTLPDLAKNVGLLGSIVHDLSPFEFVPSNKRYQEIVRGVMGIFDKATFRDIPVQVRIEAADVLGQVGDPRLEDDPVIKIKGGRFWMGAQKRDSNGRNYDEDAYEAEWAECPVHEVELSSIQISKYPVTVGQYKSFIEDGGYEEERFWTEGGFGDFKEPDQWEEQLQYPSRPVVYVGWHEAAAYARWSKGRLPTEAEWERTARGSGKIYRKYPWGNKKPHAESANFSDSNIGHITPVGIFPINATLEGVIDMAGNVWEWCADWYSENYYEICAEQGLVKNPSGPETGTSRVVRGGAFLNAPDDLRCANRDWLNPDNRFGLVGFRIVRVV